jgi:hypothetical protein
MMSSPGELILYLEPTRHTTLHTQLTHYFTSTTLTPFAGNEATRYPPHATMVGVFNTPSPPIHSTTVPQILEYINAWHAHLPTTAAPPASATATTATTATASTLINGCIRPNSECLLIGITPSPHLTTLIQGLSKAFPDLGLRLKQINHLSLCYWDAVDPFALTASPKPQTQSLHNQRVDLTDQASRLAQEKIPMIDIPPGTTVKNESWDVVLYSIEGRSKVGGLPYPLQEIKRWTLPPTV